MAKAYTRILEEIEDNGVITYRPQYRHHIWQRWKDFTYDSFEIRWHRVGNTKQEAEDIIDKYLFPKYIPREVKISKIIEESVYKY